MGELNSSKTRVVPVFKKLFAADPSGASWLPALIGLGSRADQVPAPEGPHRLTPRHAATWGKDELSLPAPKALLKHLVEIVTPEQVNASGAKGETHTKREALARRDTAVLHEAIAHIDAGHLGRKWWVLEGPSCPDATLEMPNAVIVIEGKRTEATTTSKTTWMQGRSQLIRHMDAAMEQWPKKQVFGLLIVEGNGEADAVEVPAAWRTMSDVQTSKGVLDSSLPHRTTAEKTLFAKRDLGVTTWQAVCKQFGLAWPPG
ncbi:MAG: hypothetical protein IPJ11_01065 [Gemmatimonadetes bacterium]|nr:hypothetical protein [Gemmatimonadota bacterium]